MRPRAFSLVELLVVITVIAVLLAMLAPALDTAMGHAEATVCMSRLRVVHSGTWYYSMDHKRMLPPAQVFSDSATSPYQAYPAGYGGTSWWHYLTQPTLKLATGEAMFSARPYVEAKQKAFFCPANPTDTNVVPTFNYAWNWELSLAGDRRAWRSTRSVHYPQGTLLIFDQNPNFRGRAAGAYHAYFSPSTNNGGVNTFSRFYYEYRPTWHNEEGAFAFVDGHTERLAPGADSDESNLDWHRLLVGDPSAPDPMP